MKERIRQFCDGITALGFESIPGPHAVIPVLVRDTAKTHKIVQYLYDKGILVVGLTFPVVPRGNETIRFQINAAHTKADVDYAIKALADFKS